MRNVLIHEYFGVDDRVLWRTVQEDIPPLGVEVRKILDEMDAKSWPSLNTLAPIPFPGL